MATMRLTALTNQKGQGLVQTMVGMILSLLVVMAAFSAFAWIQRSQTQLQTQIDLYQRLHTSVQWVRERAQRAGAPELVTDSQGLASLAYVPVLLAGNDTQLQLMQFRSLTPADCQGHQASTLAWIQDDFRRNSSREFTCKDMARSNTTYQALIDHVDDVRFRYAQSFHPNGTDASTELMQWRTSAQVTDWNAIRAIQLCLQVSSNAITSITPSLSCNKLVPLKNGALAWRSVLYLNHSTKQ
jgi:hypothetical protein